MNLLDKLLLVLLLLMLPLGVVASKKLLGGSLTADKPSEFEQLGQTLEKIADKQKTPGSAIPEIGITGVVASSESGMLTVAGVAPSESTTVTVTATILPTATAETGTQKKSDEVLGQTVEIKAIKPKAGGSFSFNYPVRGVTGVVELRFEQGMSVTTVQYDMKERKQIFLKN